jgi:hypothetical protein
VFRPRVRRRGLLQEVRKHEADAGRAVNTRRTGDSGREGVATRTAKNLSEFLHFSPVVVAALAP